MFGRNNLISVGKVTMALALCTLLLITAIPAEYQGLSPKNHDHNPKPGVKGTTRAVPDVPLAPANWTVMLYLAGDNSLSDAAVEDYEEMLAAGMNPGVNTLVLMDERGYSNTGLYALSEHGNSEIDLDQVNPSWADEVNMAHPDTLRDFVNFAMGNSYSRHYALFLWDHGGGWQDGVCQDGSDWLELDELDQALDQVTDQQSRTLDIIGFDACLMGQTEVFYQVKEHGDYFLGSAESEPLDGWDYQAIFSGLDEWTTPEELGTLVVDSYIESFTDGESDPEDDTGVTLALVNNTLQNQGLDNALATKINHLAQLMIKGLRQYQYLNLNPIKSAYSNTNKYSVYDYIDLYNFAYNLYHEEYPVGQLGLDIIFTAEEIMDIMNQTVYYRHGGNQYWDNTKGLSIYLTNYYHILNSKGGHRLSSYEDADFAMDTKWNEFVDEFNEPSPTGLINIEPQCDIAAVEFDGGTLSAHGGASDSALDTNAVTGVEVKVDHGPWLPASVNQIPPGQNYAWQIDEPMELVNGVHYLRVRAYDGADYSDHSYQVGAAWQETFTVDEPLAELFFQSMAYTTSTHNDYVQDNYTVKNVGDLASGDFMAQVFLDGGLHTSVSLNLGPDEQHRIPVVFGPLQPGQHHISVVMDPERNVTEYYEDNNVHSHALTREGYGLMVTAPEGDIYVEKGGSRSLDLGILNDGTYFATYEAVITAPDGWSVSVSTDKLNLSAGQEGTMQINIVPGQDAYVGQDVNIAVNVSCLQNPQTYRLVSLKALVVVLFNDVEGTQDQWSVANEGTGSVWHTVQQGRTGRGWYCGNDASHEYDPNTDAYLLSPEIDLGGLAEAELQFDHRYEAELSYDGGAVYLLRGEGYEQIEPLAGYPASYIDALEDGDGYSGKRGWTQAKFDLGDETEEVFRLAFRFASDSSVNYRGWDLDNIVVTGEVVAHDAAVDSVSIQGDNLPGSQLDITVTASNQGLLSEDFKVNLMVASDSGEENLGNKTITGLMPGQTQDQEWTYVAIEEGYYSFIATALLDGDENPANDEMERQIGVFTYEPVVYVDEPQEGAVVDGEVRIEGRASDPNGAVEKVEVAVDGGGWDLAVTNNNWADWRYDWDTMPYENGTHVIHARAHDGSYYSRVVNRTVTVEHRPENRAPVAVIFSPQEGDVYQYGASVQFDSTGTYDPEDDPLTYRWKSNITGLLGTEPNFSTALPPGEHKITLTVKDNYNAADNEMVNITVNQSAQEIFFSDDMETQEPWWYVWEGSGWEWGAPDFDAHSGSGVWGTNLSGNYENEADWNLTLHVDLGGASAEGLILSVYLYYDTEHSYDGCLVSASEDNSTWSQIFPREGYDTTIDGTYGSPIGGMEAFSGESDGWVRRTFDVSDYMGTDLYLLWRFASDISVNGLGTYLDDVTIYGGSTENIGPKAMISSPPDNESYQAGQDIYFDGTDSYDPDGSIVSYQWTSNISGEIGDEGAFFTSLEPGRHNITLVVKDNMDATHLDRVNITVREGVNHPPDAVISAPDEGEIYMQGEPVLFDGAESSDPDNEALDYTWTSNLDGEFGYSAYFSYDELGVGSHRITLKVSDGDLEDEAQVNITIREAGPNTPPEIDDWYPEGLYPSLEEGRRIRFSVNATDQDASDFLEAKWYIDETEAEDFGHGTVTTRSIPGEDAQSRPVLESSMEWKPDFTAQGEHQISVEISDFEDEAWQNWTLDIENVNRAPHAVITSPDDGDEYDKGETVEFDGSKSSDPDSDPLSYQWSSDVSGALSSEAEFEMVLGPGEHTITLEVDDGNGAEDETSVRITVKGAGPGGELVADAGKDRRVNRNSAFKLNASGTYDPGEDGNGNGVIDWDQGEGEDLEFKWDFGDDDTGKGRIVNKIYSEAGEYVVKLTVTNANGTKAFDEINVTVNGEPQAALSVPAEYWRVATPVTIDASGSQDSDSNISHYVFEFGDGNRQNTSSSSIEYYYQTTGQFVIKVTVYDEYGLTDQASTTLRVTTYGIPAPEIDSPEEGEVVDGTIYITGTTVGKNMATVEVDLPEEGWTEAGARDELWQEWELEWDTTEVDDGEYTLEVRAVTLEGGFEASSVLNITVRNDEGEGGEEEEQEQAGAFDDMLQRLYTMEGMLCVAVIIIGLIILALMIKLYTGEPEEEYLAPPGGGEEVEEEILEVEVIEEVEEEEEEEEDSVDVTLHFPCPKCGHEIEVPRGEEEIECPKCGAKGRVKYEESLDEGEKEKNAEGEEGEDEEVGKEGKGRKERKGEGEDGKGGEDGKKRKRRRKTKKKVKKKRPVKEGESSDPATDYVGGDMIRF